MVAWCIVTYSVSQCISYQQDWDMDDMGWRLDIPTFYLQQFQPWDISRTRQYGHSLCINMYDNTWLFSVSQNVICFLFYVNHFSVTSGDTPWEFPGPSLLHCRAPRSGSRSDAPATNGAPSEGWILEILLEAGRINELSMPDSCWRFFFPAFWLCAFLRNSWEWDQHTKHRHGQRIIAAANYFTANRIGL